MLIAALLAPAFAIPDNTTSHQAIQARTCAGETKQAEILALDFAAVGDPEGFIALGWLEETAQPAGRPTRAYA